MLLAKLHFKLPTGAHLLLMEYQLYQLYFQQDLLPPPVAALLLQPSRRLLRALLGTILGTVVVHPVVAQMVELVRHVLTILADPLVIAMFEHSKLPRRLPLLTMTRLLKLRMTS